MLEALLNQTSITKDVLPETPGVIYKGGYYVGKIKVGVDTYALVLAPKAEGESTISLKWKTSDTDTPNTGSLNDGWSNTQAMITAGADLHPAAKYCQSLNISGYTDWYLPSVDELEMCYRVFKPTTTANSVGPSGGPYGARGYNPSSIPVGEAYTSTSPAQTSESPFISGGSEAFNTNYHHASSQNAVALNWMQAFSTGVPGTSLKTTARPVRAVRRVLIESYV
jgi:hypothetical protein